MWWLDVGRTFYGLKGRRSHSDLASNLQESVADEPRSACEKLAARHWPTFQYSLDSCDDAPSEDICFLTVADYKFYRGLEALLLSLLSVYPAFKSTIYIVHDGTIGLYLRNRLLSIYGELKFWVPEVPWADYLPKNSANRKRIGILGYLNTVALSLRGYKRVVVLDSDLLIEGPLNALWAEGDQFRLVPDCGVRAWTPISTITRQPVLNSGVISVPGVALCATEEARMGSLIEAAGQPVCPLLDRFADQKVWNLFLSDQPLELLPVNYNCNSKYLFRHLSGIAQGIAAVHFAGPKPWLTWPWFEPSLDYRDAHPAFAATCWLWNDRYCRLLAAWRSRLYLDVCQNDTCINDRPRAIVSNSFDVLSHHSDHGASLHLLVADADAFGGFTGEEPCWPQQWSEGTVAVDCLHLWLPYELEPLIRGLPQATSFRIHWLLIEAPFSPEFDQFNHGSPAWSQGATCFDPWSPNLYDSMAYTVRLKLEQAGVCAEFVMV